jgi:hypothetical protein
MYVCIREVLYQGETVECHSKHYGFNHQSDMCVHVRACRWQLSPLPKIKLSESECMYTRPTSGFVVHNKMSVTFADYHVYNHPITEHNWILHMGGITSETDSRLGYDQNRPWKVITDHPWRHYTNHIWKYQCYNSVNLWCVVSQINC